MLYENGCPETFDGENEGFMCLCEGDLCNVDNEEEEEDEEEEAEVNYVLLLFTCAEAGRSMDYQSHLEKEE